MSMSTTCEDVQECLAQHLNGSMDTAATERVEKHLSHCAQCRVAMEQIAHFGLSESMLSELFGSREHDIEVSATADCRAHDIIQSMAVNVLTPSDQEYSLGRIGMLEVTGVVGIGGAGVVYKAVDSTLGRTVAVKLLNPALKKHEASRLRFAREARAMASINHENVVPVYGVSEHLGIPYFVMEYVSGETLAQRIERHGPLSTLEVTRLGYQIALGLGAAHKQGVIHRDVKPSNILLDPGVERVRVADFGLARCASDVTQTETGALVGTPHFMSPEQVKGEELDARSDLFSLGAVLYKAITNRHPFDGDSVYSLMQNILNGETAEPHRVNNNVPPWLSAFIMILLNKDRNVRFQDAESVASVLETELVYLNRSNIAESPARDWLVPLAPETNAVRRIRYIQTILTVCVLIAAFGGMWFLVNRLLKNPTHPNEPTAIIVQETSPDEKDIVKWAERIVSLQNHNATAFQVAPEMINSLHANDARSVAVLAWPKIRHEEVKTGLLKSFMIAGHANVLPVLNLGMLDSSKRVRDYADTYISEISLQKFGEDKNAYLVWYQSTEGVPVEEVYRRSVHRIVETMKGVEPTVALEVLKQSHITTRSRYDQKGSVFESEGLAGLWLTWLEKEKLTSAQMLEIAEFLKNSRLLEDENAERALRLMKNHPSVDVRIATASAVSEHSQKLVSAFLLELLESTIRSSDSGKPKAEPQKSNVMRSIASVLAALGDPQTIPQLIAILDCDNSNQSITVINEALCTGEMNKITNQENHHFQDGGWWKNWLEKNRNRLSEFVQEIAVPELEKTNYGKAYQYRNVDISSKEGRLSYFRKEMSDFTNGKKHHLWSASSTIAIAGDVSAIPVLIGAIEADNSYDTIYGVGYFGLGFQQLGNATGVEYSQFHDGAWWRRWWEENKKRFPEEIQDIPIATFPKTINGKNAFPFPSDLDTHEGRVAYALRWLRDKRGTQLNRISELFSEARDPRGIPFLISILRADKTGKAIYDIGYFGLSPLTKVDFDKSHDGIWWQAWWAAHRQEYPTAAEIPIAKPESQELSHTNATSLDVADVASLELTIDSNPMKRYFLIGETKSTDDKANRKLLVVMPGGDGGPDFQPFVRRIYKNVLSDEWLIAQPVAMKWTPSQAIVWPTIKNQVSNAQFTTEEFVESIIDDVRKRANIDPGHIYSLSWSSSGPAAYAIAFQPTKSIVGSYIAMSVFRPEWYDNMSFANGHRLFLDHSPEDRVCPHEHVLRAEKTLTELGAIVRRNEYAGGHGWQGDVFGRLREGLHWLSNR